MHYRCLWIDKDFKQFGKDSKKWASKIDKFLDKENKRYWMVQDQSATLGGRWTGSLQCNPHSGQSLKDAFTKEQLKDNNLCILLEYHNAFDVDEKHCDVCSIKDLKTKLSINDIPEEIPYGLMFFDKCKKFDPQLNNLSKQEIIDLINKKQMEGLIVVVDFHE